MSIWPVVALMVAQFAAVMLGAYFIFQARYLLALVSFLCFVWLFSSAAMSSVLPEWVGLF